MDKKEENEDIVKNFKSSENKELKNWLKRHPISRRLIRVLVQSTIPLQYLFSEQRNQLFSKGFWRFYLNSEPRTGLLENSIISPSLYVPRKDQTLIHREAKAGQWIGYDHLRDLEFGKKARKHYSGKLYYFPLEDIIQNSREELTPTGRFCAFDVYDILHFDTAKIDTLIEQGFVNALTYEEALKRVGLYDSLGAKIGVMDDLEREVYQVTPKGNGLVLLLGGGGEKVKNPKGKGVPLFEQFAEQPAEQY